MSKATLPAKVAFFGATGGCTLMALVKTLQAGIPCSALVRSQDKLAGLLKPHGLSPSSEGLTVITGNAKDVAAVKATLTANNTQECVSVIVSGIGGTPKLQLSLMHPVSLTDLTVCQDAIETLVAALKELKPQKKPTVCMVSTTGIDKTNDLPLLLRPLYQWTLHVPHADKLKSERLLLQEAAQADSACLDVVVVRASLLMDGDAKGLDKVRVGWVFPEGSASSGAPGPAVGYTITRQDVGIWMYTNIIAANDAARQEWTGRLVTLTN